ncbi:hypothetical protein AGMMS49942_10650 [Spirochaetia bacterium]|nr:hypothetical protein AGMMS49942_10650 [Spirochaetia bacterium]
MERPVAGKPGGSPLQGMPYKLTGMPYKSTGMPVNLTGMSYKGGP